MIADRLPIAIHGSAAAWAGRGVLLRGSSGTGKSTLLAGLLAAGAYLIADDLVRLVWHHGVPCATASSATGLIELRSSGIFRVATTDVVPVNLCVELAAATERERLPEGGSLCIGGIHVPVLYALPDAPPTVAQILLALCACRTI